MPKSNFESHRDANGFASYKAQEYAAKNQGYVFRNDSVEQGVVRNVNVKHTLTVYTVDVSAGLFKASVTPNKCQFCGETTSWDVWYEVLSMPMKVEDKNNESIGND